MNCACGQPLHYTDPEAQRAVEDLVERQGEFLTVVCGDKRYRVQRHYIALHGLKATDLATLASQGIVERLEETS